MPSPSAAEPASPNTAVIARPGAVVPVPLPLVIETKLWPPLVREGALPRTALVEALRESVASHAVTLLSAGAGFGKTSLLAAWYASQPVPEVVAWLTVDPADDDPVRLWTHIAETLRRTYRHRVDRASDPLPPSALQIVGTLANELAAARAPRVLVLDDFHRISDPGAVGPLDAFIEAMPPKARVVISSRTDPGISLPRLRAAGKLGELRSGDLAYTGPEAREIVTSADRGLGTRDADLLRRRTEGWPAGMHLALLAVRGREDAHEFVERFAGDTRAVADYLESEVFSALDQDTQSFLVQTSVLEELSWPLCDATLATSGSAQRLQELEQANSFLVALDERHEWYRCHQLFRDMLQRRFAQLDAGTRAMVHHRASAWYDTAGDRPALAIEHALSAEDWPEATRLILGSGLDAVRKGRWVTVLGWLSALPSEQVVSQPLLPALGASITAALGFAWDEVERWLSYSDHARERFPDRWTAQAEAFVTFPRAAFVGKDVRASIEAAKRLLSLDASLRNRSIANGTLAWALYLAGELKAAEQAAADALAEEDATAWAGARTRAYAVLSLLAGEAGEVERSLALASQAVDAAHEADVSGTAMTACASVAYALALAAAGKLGDAEKELGSPLRAGGPSNDATRIRALIALASIRRRRGRLARAQKALAEAELALRGFSDAGRLPELLAEERRRLVGTEAETRGTESLSDAELTVLRLLATDKTQREIASELFLSVNTVKTHCRMIYRKLHVGSRTDAVALARDLGLLVEDGRAQLDSSAVVDLDGDRAPRLR